MEKTETIIRKYPKAKRRFVGSMILFLQIRKSDVYNEDLDCMKQAANKIRKYPQAEADLEILETGVEIAGVFPALTIRNPEN